MSQANVVLVGDPWLWDEGQRVAATRVDTQPVESLVAVRARTDTTRPAFLAMHTVDPAQVHVGQAEPAGGASVLKVLNACMDGALARPRRRDLLRTAQQARHEAGRPEARRRAAPLRRIPGRRRLLLRVQHARRAVDLARVVAHSAEGCGRLPEPGAHRRRGAADLPLLQASGIAEPKVAVAAFNPHGGDGGTCGREEIDIIEPAVQQLNGRRHPGRRPFPGRHDLPEGARRRATRRSSRCTTTRGRSPSS